VKINIYRENTRVKNKATKHISKEECVWKSITKRITKNLLTDCWFKRNDSKLTPCLCPQSNSPAEKVIGNFWSKRESRTIWDATVQSTAKGWYGECKDDWVIKWEEMVIIF
jgi:hypothetical protein